MNSDHRGNHVGTRLQRLGHPRMIDLSAAGRIGAPDEVENVAALLVGQDGAFITGSDFLMDVSHGRLPVRRICPLMTVALRSFIVPSHRHRYTGGSRGVPTKEQLSDRPKDVQ